MPIVGRYGTISFGSSSQRVVVIEDRGNIGVDGRRLLRVKVLGIPDGCGRELELPEEDICFSDLEVG